VKELTSHVKSTEASNSDLNNRIDKLKSELKKAESIETDLKKNLESLTKENKEYLVVREQVCFISK
jgi:chromosome segregation ATPase